MRYSLVRKAPQEKVLSLPGGRHELEKPSSQEHSHAPNSRKLTSSHLMELIRLAHGGNPAAFEILYRRHRQHVYALCVRLLRDTTEAEDLAQETFMQMFRKMHTFRGDAAFSSWLYRLTMNCILMRFRRKTLVSTSLEDIVTTQEHSECAEMARPDLHLCGLPDRLNLQGAIDLLPSSCKAAFILHDVEGYKHREVATILGCSVGGSKSQLFRARKRLRELLRDRPREEARHRRNVSADSCRSTNLVPTFSFRT